MSKGGEKSLQPMTMVTQLTFLVMLEQGKVQKIISLEEICM
ncbi:hypothetical protein ECMP02155211_1757 [Escherichia coli MP021552.11]|nr:hypothetical protein ECMP02155212_5373 [Escherichia coli MP021552.12]EMU63227.1 hypothetical protein ECMP02155211_1757 [Escherichia coli MP021552.11]EMX31443.1 hypothetical protein ECMP0215528_5399 [Escherichia coli MP021552.8]